MSKTYLQIAKEIEALQNAAKKLFAVEAKSAVEKVNQLIAKYDLTPEDLRFSGRPLAAANSTVTSIARAKSRTKAGSAPKYADGLGNSWGGRGPRPGWLNQAIASGESIESFATDKAKVAERSAFPASLANERSITKSKKAKSIAPKYREPGSENTWTGRGSQPRWLKSALKKRGTRLESFLIHQDQAPTAKTSAAPKAPKKRLSKAAAAEAAVKVATEARTVKDAKAANSAPVSKKAVKARPGIKPGSASKKVSRRATAAPARSSKASAESETVPVKAPRAARAIRNKQALPAGQARKVSKTGSNQPTAKKAASQTKKQLASARRSPTPAKDITQLGSTPAESPIETAGVEAQPNA